MSLDEYPQSLFLRCFRRITLISVYSIETPETTKFECFVDCSLIWCNISWKCLQCPHFIRGIPCAHSLNGKLPHFIKYNDRTWSDKVLYDAERRKSLIQWRAIPKQLKKIKCRCGAGWPSGLQLQCRIMVQLSLVIFTWHVSFRVDALKLYLSFQIVEKQ